MTINSNFNGREVAFADGKVDIFFDTGPDDANVSWNKKRIKYIKNLYKQIGIDATVIDSKHNADVIFSLFEHDLTFLTVTAPPNHQHMKEGNPVSYYQHPTISEDPTQNLQTYSFVGYSPGQTNVFYWWEIVKEMNKEIKESFIRSCKNFRDPLTGLPYGDDISKKECKEVGIQAYRDSDDSEMMIQNVLGQGVSLSVGLQPVAADPLDLDFDIFNDFDAFKEAIDAMNIPNQSLATVPTINHYMMGDVPIKFSEEDIHELIMSGYIPEF